MYIKFWGTRGSIAAPGLKTVKFGGNTSCIEVRVDDKIFIFDAGTGIRELGMSFLNEFRSNSLKAHIFISHTHWDHIQGFPFFRPGYKSGNHFCVYGPHGTESGLEEVLSGQMEPDYFPAPLEEMRSKLEFINLQDPVKIGKTRVEFMYVNHPGLCLGYKIIAPHYTIVYTGDNERYSKVNFPNRHDKKSMDYLRDLDSHLIDFCKGADLAICDSQYTEDEYSQHRGWGHSTILDVADLATRAKVKRMALFHHDPMHDDNFLIKMETECRNCLDKMGFNGICFGAREGFELTL